MTDPTSPQPRGLRFGFSTLGCPELDVPGLRALAAGHGSRFVEIRTLGGSLDFVGTLARYPGGAAAARDFLLEAGVRVALVGSSFQLTRSPEEQRATLAAEAEAGEALGARWLRVFGGGEWGDALTPDAAAVARAHRAWWQELRTARGWSIDLILEMHDAFSGTPQVRTLFAETGGPMPLLWDTHHTWKVAGETAAETWTQLAAHVHHVHVKDSISTPSGGLDHTYIVPGSGEFPLRETLTLLAEAGFAGVVSLEWEKQWHPALAPLSDVLPAWSEVTAAFTTPTPPPSSRPTLLLKSDFDRAAVVPATGPYFHGAPEQYEDLDGVTVRPPVDEPAPDHPHLGKCRIYYEGGDAAQRSACLVPDPAVPSNRVLRFRITEPNVAYQWPDFIQYKARVQAEVYGNVEWRDFYQTVRLRFPAEMAALRDYPGKIGWFTLMEFWNNAGWTDEPHVFRFGFHLEKPDPAPGTDLYFATGSQTYSPAKGFVDIWRTHNSALPVPFGEWMRLELYFREGNADTGRFFAAVTPANGQRTVLFDVHGWTHHPDNPEPAGLKQNCPLKLYTSDEVMNHLRSRGLALEVDWDDLEIWCGRTPEDAP